MEVSGIVKEVDMNVTIKKKDGGTYKGWRLVFDDNGEDNTIEKHEMTLKKIKGLKEALLALTPGDPVTVSKEKNGMYWEITEVRKGGPGEGPPKAASGRAGRSEEESLRIVRQTCLKAAAEFCSNDTTLGAEHVIKIAEAFEEWVMR